MKKAVLVGINYKNSDLQLRGCINDVRNMTQMLTTNFGFEKDNMKILTEEDSVTPTKTNIIENIVWLTKDTKPGDTVVFYYSGHGSYVKDTTNDEIDGKDEVLVPLDYDTQGYISDDMLFSYLLLPLQAGVRVFLMTDCCHSGTLFDLKYNLNSMSTHKTQEKPTTYEPDQWLDRYMMYQDNNKLRPICDVVLISGCMDHQYSNDAYLNKTFQGALTYCFLETVKGVIENSNWSDKNVMKFKHLLKDIDCRLKVYGFMDQRCQLSTNRFSAFNDFFRL